MIVKDADVVSLAPLLSCTLTVSANVPAAVGVPLRVMVLPFSAAVRPAGRPVTARLP